MKTPLMVLFAIARITRVDKVFTSSLENAGMPSFVTMLVYFGLLLGLAFVLAKIGEFFVRLFPR